MWLGRASLASVENSGNSTTSSALAAFFPFSFSLGKRIFSSAARFSSGVVGWSCANGSRKRRSVCSAT